VGAERGDRVGVLVVRVWSEEGVPEWRARITRTTDVHSGKLTMATLASVDDVCQMVRDWLGEFTSDGGE